MCSPADVTSKSYCWIPRFIPTPADNVPKSTPLGAVAKFAVRRQTRSQERLGLITMSYGNVYVACVAMGAKDEHTLNRSLKPKPTMVRL